MSYLAGVWGRGLLCEGHGERAGEAIAMSPLHARDWAGLGWAGLRWGPFCPGVSARRGEGLGYPKRTGRG